MLRTLEKRRETLVARSGVLRARITGRLAPGARMLARADRFTARVRSHPVLASVGLCALALAGPRAVVRWALRITPLYALLARL